MTKVQFIRQINFETQKLLKRIHKQSSHHQVYALPISTKRLAKTGIVAKEVLGKNS